MHAHAKELLYSTCWIVSLLIEFASSCSFLCRFSVSPWSSTSRSHTLNIVPVQLAKRVWWAKSHSSLLNSIPFSYYRVIHFCYDMWRSTFQIGAALLRSVREIAPKSSFLSVNRSLTRYDFGAGAKAIRLSVNRAGKSFGLTTSFLC